MALTSALTIDMDALAAHAKGDPEERVPVTRRMLAEIERRLREGAAAQAQLRANDQVGSVAEQLAMRSAAR